MKRLLLPAMVLLCSAAMTAEAGTAHDIEEFYGDYVGHAVIEDKGSEVDRDLSVSIRPARKNGRFFIKWATVIHKANGKLKRQVYNIKFAPTQRKNIYSSAMKTNVFGGAVALDPIKGDPFVWARIKDATLTVHALIIHDDGGYEMQIYDRTINKEGLLLNYTRTSAGDDVKRIQTQLVRVAD